MRSGSINMASQQTVHLIYELVKHLLSAKKGFLLALSLKGIYFHSKLFKLTLALIVILNYLTFCYLGMCCFLLPGRSLQSPFCRGTYNRSPYLFYKLFQGSTAHPSSHSVIAEKPRKTKRESLDVNTKSLSI